MNRFPSIFRLPAFRSIRVFLALFALPVLSSVAAEEAEIGSAAWLERGCLAIRITELDGKNASADQKVANLATSFYLQGYLSGVNAMMLADEEKTSPIFEFPNEWHNPKKAARLLLTFIEERRELIDPQMPASRLVTAWYFLSHPKASDFHKNMGLAILEKSKRGGRGK